MNSRKGQRDKKTQTKRKKKKLSCRQRCARCCCRFCCRRIKRCINKKIFGVPEPLADVDLGKVKSKLKLNATGSILNIFQNALQRKDSKGNDKNIDFTNIVAGELKRKYSIKGSKEKVLNNIIDDYKKGTLSLSKFKTSNLDVKNLNKNQVHDLLKDYEAAQREKYADLNADDLKKKFKVNKSQEKALDKMVDDLKRGKLSATAISNIKEIDPKKLDKNKLNDMLQKYQARPSFVAKKFSIKGSKEKVLENFLQDYKKGKLSATKLIDKTGFDPNKLNKEDLNNILNKYREKQNNKPLFGETGSRIYKFLEDFKSFQNHPSLIDLAKRKVSEFIKR